MGRLPRFSKDLAYRVPGVYCVPKRRRTSMFRHIFYIQDYTRRAFALPTRSMIALLVIMLLGLLLTACDSNIYSSQSNTATKPTGGGSTSTSSFPQTAPPLRVPTFGNAGQVAPTVKVLPSLAPTLIVQFPLFPASVKQLFPNASGLVTVFQNPTANDFDSVTVNVQNMPPGIKFTVFFTEISAKPFGHGEYVGDLTTRSDGTGESVFHLITFVAFAADHRNPGTSADQSGTASGIQLEHVGMWFDGVGTAREVLHNPGLAGTPFDGGHGVLHAGPQAMTDGQALPVI